jgi:von Willebrand factor type A domain
VLGATLTFLSPRAALVGIPGLVAVLAALYGRRRADAVRRALRLPPPEPKRARLRVVLVATLVGLLALVAAQPALTHERHVRVRHDTQALFVLDVSRSMAASASPTAPTRLDRAVDAAVKLRASIPGVSAGVATLTDRVLPDLFPVADVAGFERVVRRGVSIESPPPQTSAARATSYDALQQIPGAGYFDPRASSRVVVVLTDGETAPVQTGEIASAFATTPGYRLLFLRLGHPNEQVFDADGRPESGYRPDPTAGATLDSLASALDARSYGEHRLGDAQRRLQRLVGTGPTTESPSTVRTQTPLAPYPAGLGLLVAIGLIALPSSLRARVPWAAS